MRVTYKLTPEDLQAFHDDLSRTRNDYRRTSAKNIDVGSLRGSADILNDRTEDYEKELETGNIRARLKGAQSAIEAMNIGMESLADELRHLADLLEIHNNSKQARSDRESDEALDALKKRMEQVKKLNTELMDKVKKAGEAMSRSSGGSGKRDSSRWQGKPYWLDGRASGAEYPW